MDHTLEFLIVLASMISTVLRCGSGMSPCPEERYQKFVDPRLQCRYETFLHQASYDMTRYNVQRDIPKSVFAHVSSVSVHQTVFLKQVGCDERHTVVPNATLLWEYECDVAAVANIVPDEGSEFFQIQPEGCLVYTLTKEEQWKRACEIRDNFREHIKDSVLYQSIDDSDIPENIRTEIRNQSLSTFEIDICSRMNEDLRTVSNLTEDTFPLPLLVDINHIVDKSLIRYRENIAKARAESVELQNVHLPVYATYGDYAGDVILTGGIFEGFSTIERDSYSSITIQANAYYIKSSFTFRRARVHFDTYHFPSEKVPFDDIIYIIIQNSQIQVEHSGVWDSGVCNESVWVNITSMSGIVNEYPIFKTEHPLIFNASIGFPLPHELEMKEILGPYIAWNLFRYGAADTINYIYGPCMSNSSKEWRRNYASETNYHFTL